MSEQQTALQDLIEWLDKIISDCKNQANHFEKLSMPNGKISSESMGMAYQISKEKATKLLSKEKEQIVNSHIAGQKFASDNDNPDSEEYYTQTFTKQ